MSVQRCGDNSIETTQKRSVEEFEINQDECADSVALDVDMMSVLQNRKLKGDLKWFQYYKALERYLYKRYPTFEPLQFTFDVQEDVVGEFSYVIKPGKKKKSPFAKLLKYTPSIVGPLLGAALTALLRS
jgi:hypothetical protein